MDAPLGGACHVTIQQERGIATWIGPGRWILGYCVERCSWRPSVSAGEADRLAALRRYRILDTEPEQRFDDLVLLALHVCGTPMAAITLIDSDRQWFKARIGVSVSQTSRDIAFCAHAIQQRELFVVPDTLRDARFRTIRSCWPSRTSGSMPGRRS